MTHENRIPHILLLCGGKSGEHDVSLASARSVLHAAASQYRVTPLVIDSDGRLLPPQASRELLALEVETIGGTSSKALSLPDTDTQALSTLLNERDVDVVFPVLHGPNGEDGTIQGMLKLLGVPFVGSGVLGSAVGMDKLMMKRVYSAHGLSQVPYVGITRYQWYTNAEAVIDQLQTELVYPMFVKPANLGSSVGISKARTAHELSEAIETAIALDRRIIVEQGIEACELEVAVLGNDAPKASVVGEIRFDSDFYDYETKYTSGLAQLDIPAQIPNDISEKIRRMAVEAFLAVDAAGLARVDFFYVPTTEQVYINEINTMPGFTSTSMYPKLWEASGVSYAELVNQLITLACDPR